ncbi:hypothetical protein ACI4BE_29415, partial [Klebsiella pneumoniae]|uniref:hypothetical protein n=1 Tax=Klebsiella pneumoniae TaxID=573 RepID=UPI0038518EFF
LGHLSTPELPVRGFHPDHAAPDNRPKQPSGRVSGPFGEASLACQWGGWQRAKDIFVLSPTDADSPVEKVIDAQP